MASSVDLSDELDALDAREREQVEQGLLRHAAGAVVACGALCAVALPALLGIDGLRFATGRHAGAPAVLLLWIAHALFAAAVIPAARLWMLRRRQPEAIGADLQRAHVVLFAAGALLLGWGGIALRGAIIQMMVAAVVVNLVHTVSPRWRAGFNLLLGVGSLVLASSYESSGGGGFPGDARRILLGEVVTVLFVATATGTLVQRQRLMVALGEARMARLTWVDALTGVASRRRIEEVLRSSLANASDQSRVSIVLLDVDRFKAVNDTWGHNAGDHVLRDTARILQQRARLDDVIGRWGGEEFVVVCRGTPAEGARLLADGLRERLEAHVFPSAGKMTASFGVAEALPGESADAVIERADRALYEAKRSGRNRVCLAG